MNNSSKSLKLFFVISLLLNLLLAGVIGGHIWWHISSRWSDKINELTQGLPPEKQKKLLAVMDEIHNDMEPLRTQITAARAAAAKLLKADPFDKPAYLSAMQHVRDLHAQLNQKISNHLADIASSLTPDERAILADIPPPMTGERNFQTSGPDCKPANH